MKVRALVTLFALVAAASAHAGLFGPSQQEIQNTLQAYFNRPGVGLEDFQGLDLAILKTDRDASVLAYALGKQMDLYQKQLDCERCKLEKMGKEVERLFTTLYTKEVHDEFYNEIRPSKQAAFRKALADVKPQKEKIAQMDQNLNKATEVQSVLKRIASEFRELAPSRRMLNFRQLEARQ